MQKKQERCGSKGRTKTTTTKTTTHRRQGEKGRKRTTKKKHRHKSTSPKQKQTVRHSITETGCILQYFSLLPQQAAAVGWTIKSNKKEGKRISCSDNVKTRMHKRLDSKKKTWSFQSMHRPRITERQDKTRKKQQKIETCRQTGGVSRPKYVCARVRKCNIGSNRLHGSCFTRI